MIDSSYYRPPLHIYGKIAVDPCLNLLEIEGERHSLQMHQLQEEFVGLLEPKPKKPRFIKTSFTLHFHD